MATAPAPERPGKGTAKVRVSLRGRGRVDARGKYPITKSPVLGTPQGRRNFASGSPAQQIAQEDAQNAQEAIQPDFMNPEGGVGEGEYGPQLLMNDEGGYGDEYGPQQPPVDDKDASNAQENGVNEQGGVGQKPYGPDLATAENNASPTDGQDDSTRLRGEDDEERGAWANATRQAGKNAGEKIKSKGYRNKKGVFIIFGTIGIVFTIVGSILTIPQLAINTALDKLTNSFSERINFAVEKRFEKYVGLYVTKSVAPSMANGRCGQVLKPDCIKVNNGDGIVRTFITGLNDARIESRLERNSGVTFQRRPNTNEIDVFQNGKNLGSVQDNLSVRQLQEFIRNEGDYDGVLKRRDLRTAGKRYGAKWCLSFIVNEKICGVRNRAETANQRFSAFKRRQLLLIARVAEPVSTRGAAVLFCLITPKDCASASGKIDRDTGLDESLRIVGQADNDGFRKIIEEIGDKRISQYLVDKILDVTIRKALPKLASAISGATNPVTAIYTAAVVFNLLDTLDNAIDDGAISEFVLDQNTQAAILFLSAYTAAMEEAASFLVPVPEVMATFQSLVGFDRSRMYQALSNQEELSARECEDNYVIPANSDELACPEHNLSPDIPIEDFLQGSGVQLGVNTLLSVWRGCVGGVPKVAGVCPTGTTVKGLLTPVLQTVDTVAGGIGAAVQSGLRVIPGVGDFIDFMGEQGAKVIATVIEKAFPIVINPTALGANAFDQLAAGYDALYNRLLGGYEDESGQYQGYGAGEISPAAAREVDLAIAEWREENLQKQSVFARYLDVFNHQSLAASAVVRLSSVLPFSGGTFKIDSLPTNIFKSFGSIIGGRASAVTNRSSVFNEVNFGIRQHYFTLDQLDSNPETYTEEYCEREEEAFFEARENGDSTSSSMCLFDKALAEPEGVFLKAFNLDPAGSHTGAATSNQASQVIGIAGPYIPCDINETGRAVVPSGDGANWGSIPSSGTIGTGSDGTPINVYVRNSCDPTPSRTVVLASSIHGTENGGQLISHEMLFNEKLPKDVRVIAIPEINKSAINNTTRKNANGVDVNRNFDFSWSTLNESRNTDPTSDFYKGPSAASEPETQAVANFLNQLGKTSLFISYHDRLNYVSSVGSTSSTLSDTYVGLLNAALRSSGNETTRANNIPATRGSMDGWYNNISESPSLLVEMTNTRTDSYIQAHVDTLVKMLEEGVIQ